MSSKKNCHEILNRRKLIKHGLYSGLTTFLSPSLFLSGCAAKKDQDNNPNVILISIDTLRADHLGCYGYEKNTSPNIDDFARNTVFFENAYSPWPKTVPALRSIMTGSLVSNERDEDVLSHYSTTPYLTEVLSKKGYYTAGFTDHFAIGVSNKQWYVAQKGFHTFENFGKDCKDVTSHILTEEVIKWLSTHHKDKFFLWVHYFDPHFNYCPLPKYEKLFGFSETGHGRIYNPMDISEIREIEKNLTNEEVESLMCLYDSEIFYTDKYVGNLLEKIKDLKLWENTIIAITADHGEEFRERTRVGHGTTVYNELIRVPLMVRMPNHAPSGIKANTSTMEIFNIVCNLVSNRKVEFHDTYVISRTHPTTRKMIPKLNEFAIVCGDYKYICNPETGSEEFYYLKDDAVEKNNLLMEPVHKDKKNELRGKLVSWILKNNVKVQMPSEEVLKREEELNRRLRSLGYVI